MTYASAYSSPFLIVILLAFFWCGHNGWWIANRAAVLGRREVKGYEQLNGFKVRFETMWLDREGTIWREEERLPQRAGESIGELASALAANPAW